MRRRDLASRDPGCGHHFEDHEQRGGRYRCSRCKCDLSHEVFWARVRMGKQDNLYEEPKQ